MCPAKSKRSDVGCGYSSLAETIAQFVKCDQLPSCVNLRVLDEGDGVEATCARHNACWHKKCIRQSLHTTKINRILHHSAESHDASSDSDRIVIGLL